MSCILLVNLNWSIHIGSCTFCVCVSHLFTHIFAQAVDFFSPTTAQGCKLQHMLSQASSTGVVQVVFVCAAQQEVFFVSFPYKVKTVLFVSSGPKPCEACRQEEIYEEPISILNSNEVSREVFVFNLVSTSYLMNNHPCWFSESFLTGFPHDNELPQPYATMSCLSCLPAITGLSQKKKKKELFSSDRYFQTMLQDEK